MTLRESARDAAPTLDQIADFIAMMQPILGLSDWRIDVLVGGSGEMDDGNWAEVRGLHAYQRAIILVSGMIMSGEHEDWRIAVAHEMKHLHAIVYRATLMLLLADQPVAKQLVIELDEAHCDRAATAFVRLVDALEGERR